MQPRRISGEILLVGVPLISAVLLSFLLTLFPVSKAEADDLPDRLSAMNDAQVRVTGDVRNPSLTGTATLSITSHGASALSSITTLTKGSGSVANAGTTSSNSGDVDASAIFTNSNMVSDGSRHQTSSFAVQAAGAVTAYSVSSQ